MQNKSPPYPEASGCKILRAWANNKGTIQPAHEQFTNLLTQSGYRPPGIAAEDTQLHIDSDLKAVTLPAGQLSRASSISVHIDSDLKAVTLPAGPAQ